MLIVSLRVQTRTSQTLTIISSHLKSFQHKHISPVFPEYHHCPNIPSPPNPPTIYLCSKPLNPHEIIALPNQRCPNILSRKSKACSLDAYLGPRRKVEAVLLHALQRWGIDRKPPPPLPPSPLLSPAPHPTPPPHQPHLLPTTLYRHPLTPKIHPPTSFTPSHLTHPSKNFALLFSLLPF